MQRSMAFSYPATDGAMVSAKPFLLDNLQKIVTGFVVFICAKLTLATAFVATFQLVCIHVGHQVAQPQVYFGIRLRLPALAPQTVF